MEKCDVAVIGAGPYGLSAAAHLTRSGGLQVRVFGESMSFWQRHMPAGMRLRSGWEATHIADPDRKLTLDVYKAVSGNNLSAPVPLDRFIDYGRWFQRQVVPQVDRRNVTSIRTSRQGFQLGLEDGETLEARRVIVAAGIAPFAWRPPQFDGLPPALASHSSQHSDFGRFQRRKVLVVGGGQSSLESAALLYEAGAEPEVMVRRPRVHWLGWSRRLSRLGPLWGLLYSKTDVGPAGISQIVSHPNFLRRLPRGIQERFGVRCVRPAGAAWLRPRLERVAITTGRSITAAAPVEGRLRLTLDDGSERRVDHLLLATGYRVDISRYPFLTPELLAAIPRVNGYPKLNDGFEALPGLHFLGATAAWSFGPVMRFVSGTDFAVGTVANYIRRALA